MDNKRFVIDLTKYPVDKNGVYVIPRPTREEREQKKQIARLAKAFLKTLDKIEKAAYLRYCTYGGNFLSPGEEKEVAKVTEKLSIFKVTYTDG